MDIVNEETIVPEKVDAIVADETETVEAVEADAKPDETEETDSGEVEATSEEVDEPEESSTSKEDGTQGRFDELTKFRREAERERDYWKNLAQQNQVAPDPVEPGKTLADFEYDEGKYREYEQALAKEMAQAEVKQQAQQEENAIILDAFSEHEAEFSNNVDDYHTTLKDAAFVTEDIAAATLYAEQGPALRYYLAKNPEVSSKLAKMHPYNMAMELGRIEATKLGKEKAPSVTKAPKPAPKIAATDSKSPLRIDDPKISDAQFRKIREKQIANR